MTKANSKSISDDKNVSRLERLVGGFLNETTPRVRRGLGLSVRDEVSNEAGAGDCADNGSASAQGSSARLLDPLEEEMSLRLQNGLGPASCQ